MAGHHVYIREKKTKAGKRGVMWPEKKRLEVVSTYLTCSSPTMTSGITGVPVKTIELWMRQPWWKEYIQEFQYEDDLKIDAKLSKILDKSMEQVLDRLENGEAMYDPRTGKIKRIPAKLRDINKIATDAVDKKQLLRKAAKTTNTQDSTRDPTKVTADHLVQLAQAFAQMATGKTPHPKEVVGELIEGEAEDVLEELGYIDALHEEWKA